VTDKAADPWFEPLSEYHLRSPYDTYRRLRGEQPVYWHNQLQSWLVSRHDHCSEVLSRADIFAADFRRAGRSEDQAMVSILTLDPPEHDPYRELIAGGLSPRHWAAVLAENDAWLADQVSTRLGTEIDLVNELCLPLALRSVAAVMGIEPINHELMDASAAVVASMFSGFEPAAQAPGMAARAELSRILAETARTAPAGLLAQVRDHPELPYLVNSMRVVLLAGINSASRFLGLALMSLLSGPGLESLPAAAQLPTAVNELIRFDGPFQAMSRIVVADCDFHGQAFCRGQEVITLLGSANRDPRIFAEPDALVLGRSPNPHLGFGRGMHACVGARFAVSLTVGLLTCLARQAPGTKLAGQAIMDRNPTLRGVMKLPAVLS
jgi:hypothetical protein